MRHRLLLLFAFVFHSLIVWSQDRFVSSDTLSIDPDTMIYSEKLLGVVEIVRVYYANNELESPDSLRMQSMQSMDLGRFLEKLGMSNITNYGSKGTASLLRSNGLSPDHNQLLWSGVSLNSPTLGMADYSLVPVFFFESISTDLNTGALGAIGNPVRIGNAYSYPLSRLAFFHEMNSIDNRFTGASYLGQKSKWKFHSAFFTEKFDNQFSYIDTYQFGNPEMVRKNGFGVSSGVKQLIGYEGTKHQVSGEFWFIERNMELPGMMGISVPLTQQLQDDRVMRTRVVHSIKFDRNPLNDAWIDFKHGLYFLRDEQRYRLIHRATETEQIYSSVGADQLFYRADFSREVYMRYTVHLNGQVRHISALYGERKVTQNVANADAVIQVSIPRGFRVKFMSNNEWREGQTFVPSFILRSDKRFSIRNNDGFIWVEGAQKIRYPDLNELYWQPDGNPNLSAEKSRMARAGFEWYKWREDFNVFLVQAHVFYNRVNDWIQWIPAEGGITSPVNFKQVISRGFHAEAKYNYRNGKWRANAIGRYQFVDAQGKNETGDWFQMVYQPKHTVYAGIEALYSKWIFLIDHRFIGERKTDESTGYNVLESYLLFDASIARKFKLDQQELMVRLGCDNIANVSYESIRAFAMPGRVFTLQVNFYLINHKQ